VTLAAGFTYLFLGFQYHDAGYSLGKAVGAGALGALCCLCYALPASYLGSKTGQTHSLLTRSIFGLVGSAAAMGMDAADLERYEPQPGCQTYAAYVAWLALNGAQGDVALALIANFGAWGSYCGAVAEALRSRYGLDDKACAFFDFFATPVPEVEEQALAVARASMAAGEPPQLARRYARLIQAYELDFWEHPRRRHPRTHLTRPGPDPAPLAATAQKSGRRQVCFGRERRNSHRPQPRAS
jgi:hypothetical protein